MPKFFDNKVKPTLPGNANPDRYELLGLRDSEPSLGVPEESGQILSSDTEGNRTWANKELGISTLGVTSGLLNPGDAYDFTLQGTSILLVKITTDYPTWVRGYSSAAARVADTRTNPGAPYPSAGSGFYTEVVTEVGSLEIEMSPAPVIYGPSGISYWRAVNEDSVARVITMDFTVIVFASA